MNTIFAAHRRAPRVVSLTPDGGGWAINLPFAGATEYRADYRTAVLDAAFACRGFEARPDPHCTAAAGDAPQRPVGGLNRVH